MKTETRGWPLSRRKAQAARIRQQKPWGHATGPKTEAGRQRVRLNAVKHNMRSDAMLRLRRALKRQRRFMQLLERDFVERTQFPAVQFGRPDVAQQGHRQKSDL